MAKKNRWDDHYSQRARREKWLARSVYKLEEIDKKFNLIKPGIKLLDLGCYPGSWSQYCLKKIGTSGLVVGIDKNVPHQLSAPNFRFIKADILKIQINQLAETIGFQDLVISDLAPQTTGIRLTDESRSIELAKHALNIAISLLDLNKNFLCKLFEGEDLKVFKDDLLKLFKQVRLVRPSAIRKKSREIYLLGIGLREY